MAHINQKCTRLCICMHTWAGSIFTFSTVLCGCRCKSTSVMVVPAPSVVVLEDLWWTPRLQQVVHLVLLSPGKRLTQDFTGLVDVEVPRSKETQDVLILRDLSDKGRASKSARTKLFVLYTSADNPLIMIKSGCGKMVYHLSLVCLLQPFAKSDQTALLQGGQVT